MWTDEDIEAMEARYNEREDRLLGLMGEIVGVFGEIHRSYGSTAVCWGGIGGQAITTHCTWNCDNPTHDEVNTRLHRLLAEASRLAQGGAL